MWSLGKGAGCRAQGEGEGVGCRDYGVEFGVEVMGEGGGGTRSWSNLLQKISSGFRFAYYSTIECVLLYYRMASPASRCVSG